MLAPMTAGLMPFAVKAQGTAAPHFLWQQLELGQVPGASKVARHLGLSRMDVSGEVVSVTDLATPGGAALVGLNAAVGMFRQRSVNQLLRQADPARSSSIGGPPIIPLLAVPAP